MLLKSFTFSIVILIYLNVSSFVFGANPNYSYHVKIQDLKEGNFQEKAESRLGDYTEGFYR